MHSLYAAADSWHLKCNEFKKSHDWEIMCVSCGLGEVCIGLGAATISSRD